MSELSKLFGKPETVKIKGVEFKIKPLTLSDLALIGDVDPDKPSVESLKKLIEKVLRDSFPDASDDEVKNFPLEFVNELSEHVAKINKFNTSDTKSELLQRIKKT